MVGGRAGRARAIETRVTILTRRRVVVAHAARPLARLGGDMCVCGCCVSQDQGKLDEAEPLLLRSLAIREKALGADHPDVAQGCNNLALLYKVRAPRDEGGNHHTSV